MSVKILFARNPVIDSDRALKGQVEWTFASQPEDAVLTLNWFTSGKGYPITQSIEQIRFHELRPQQQHRFTFHVPFLPYSFQGKLLGIHWAVGLKVTFVQEIADVKKNVAVHGYKLIERRFF